MRVPDIIQYIVQQWRWAGQNTDCQRDCCTGDPGKTNEMQKDFKTDGWVISKGTWKEDSIILQTDLWKGKDEAIIQQWMEKSDMM